MKFPKRKVKIVNRILYVLIIIMITLSLALVGRATIKQQIDSAITIKQENFTEIYFENHLSLPKLTDPEKIYSFKFTLHNELGSDHTYTYAVYYSLSGVKYFIDKNGIFIKNNKYKSIQETFVPTPAMPRVEIIVELLDTNQKIGFWTELYK